MEIRSAIELADRHLPPYRQGELAVMVERSRSAALPDGRLVRPVVRQATADLIGEDEGLFFWRDRPYLGEGHISGLPARLPMTEYLELPEPAHVRSDTQYVALCMSAAKKAGVRYLAEIEVSEHGSRRGGIAWLWAAWHDTWLRCGITWHLRGGLVVVKRKDAGAAVFNERCSTLSDALAHVPDEFLDSAIAVLAKPAAPWGSA